MSLRVGTQVIKELRVGTQKMKEAWVGRVKVYSGIVTKYLFRNGAFVVEPAYKSSKGVRLIDNTLTLIYDGAFPQIRYPLSSFTVGETLSLNFVNIRGGATCVIRLSNGNFDTSKTVIQTFGRDMTGVGSVDIPSSNKTYLEIAMAGSAAATSVVISEIYSRM